ncbi:MAG: DUF2162 family putative transporter [Verrucomicrobiota bacterium]|nr:DUF2162 family putative transporter [Verrucomicrobiota bacterium]
MIETFWIVGCLIALSSFGIKVGLGLAAALFDDTAPFSRRWGFLAAVFGIYAAVFVCVYLTAKWTSLPALFGFLIGAARYGMWIHIGLAFALLAWGVVLLRGPSCVRGHSGASRGRWLLVMPCPVCATVILGAGLVGRQLFLLPAGIVSLLLGAMFLGLALLAVLAALPFRRQIAAARDTFMGVVMTIAAVFFLLTILVAPIYMETREVFTLARQAKKDTAPGQTDTLMLTGISAALFAIGFFAQRRRFVAAVSPPTPTVLGPTTVSPARRQSALLEAALRRAERLTMSKPALSGRAEARRAHISRESVKYAFAGHD